ncbi:MAG: hypothetical protein GEU74_01550 [Nitriliruptorales bacterium]|nr:hypothetical protein [Nitriliruptorales bacterium]
MSSLARVSRFQRLAVVTAILSLLLVAVGGAVRATDSGLACPTWPGCFSAGDFVPPAGLHVWLEHSHRLIAGGLGILVAVQAVWAVARYRHRIWVVWPSAVAAVAVVVQAILGALVVLHLLRAELVTAHLGMGMLVVGCLIVVAVNAGSGPLVGAVADRRFTRAAAAVAGVTLLQIMLGGHVSGTAAGLVYSRPGAPLWGAVGVAPVESARHAFNLGHRLLGIMVAAAVMWLIVVAHRTGQTGWTVRLPRIAAWLVVLQIAIGLGNLVSALSFVTVIPHLVVASWIWAVLCLTTVLGYRALSATASEPAGSPPPGRRQPVAAL